MKLSIIVPTYNEKNTILKTINRLKKLEIKKEIIIVDDGSSDGTREILKKLNQTDKLVTVLFNKLNMGKGTSIRKAIPLVSGDYTIIQDADSEYDPRDILKLLALVSKEKALVVYGSRFTGERKNMFFWHTFGNKLLTTITNLLYGTKLSDMETCYKLIQSGILKKIRLNCQKFEFEPEITAKILKRGIKIYEVPITYEGRKFSQGKKISWKDAFPAIKTLLKYRFSE